ncbi:MAG: hypothetical protein ACYDH9_08965 [Limisphaerales bacterium]
MNYEDWLKLSGFFLHDETAPSLAYLAPTESEGHSERDELATLLQNAPDP